MLKFDKNWKNISCDLNTCSDANVIGYKRYCELAGNANSVLKSTKSQLRSFGGTKIETMGGIEFICKRNSKNYTLNFLAVNGDHGPLLSEKACLALGLIKYCFKLSSNNSDKGISQDDREKAFAILQTHERVFRGYGNILGNVSLEIETDAKPVIQPARRIPVSLRQDLKNELVRLEKEGIITKENNNAD